MSTRNTIQITRGDLEALVERAFKSGYACGMDDDDGEGSYESRVQETWLAERDTLDIPT